MTKIGYARVSSQDQNLDRQIAALRGEGCDRIFDDPVQSMDELHISQFAALLRTISRNQHRKIIIAVHEKPLFDYLSLELSPAFETDKLLTLEVRRGIDDDTQVVPRYLPYQRTQSRRKDGLVHRRCVH